MSRYRFIILPLSLLVLLLAHGIALIYRVQPAVSLWFPPSGIAIALTLWLGPIGIALTAIASVLMAPLWGNTGWSCLVGAIDAVEPLTAWLLFRYGFRGSLSFKRMRDGVVFLISAPLVTIATINVLVVLLDYVLLYPRSLSLSRFPLDADLLHLHKLSLLVQCAVGLLVGIAMTERASSLIALTVEQTRLTEYQTRAQLGENLFQLNRMLSDANRRLVESEERFRTSVETMLDCFGMYSAIRDPSGQIIDFRIDYVNDAACSNNDLAREQQINRTLCEILPGHRDSGLFDEYCQVVETGQPLIKDELVYEDDYG